VFLVSAGDVKCFWVICLHSELQCLCGRWFCS